MKRILLALALLWAAPALAQSSAPSLVVPTCYPTVKWPLAEAHAPLPAGVSMRYTMSSVWVCAQPSGYATFAFLFTPSPDVLQTVWNYLLGNWTVAQAQADCRASCTVPTDSENAYLQTLTAKYRPIALVAFNGSNTTRSVFTAQADGSLNASPVAGEAVAVGAKCNETRRISGSIYFAVDGLPNASSAGATLPIGSYAICVLSFPLAPN